MYFEIENPGAYRAALYIRLSKEDENEGPSQSVTNQQSLLPDELLQGLLVGDAFRWSFALILFCQSDV